MIALANNAPPFHGLLIDPERAAVDAARAGDRDAFDALMRRYEQAIFAAVYRLMADADDAHDQVQECFTRAWAALPDTRDDLQYSAWLHRIAHNGCLDVLRRRQRYRWLPWEGPRHDHLMRCAPADEPERAAIGHETAAAVRQALGKMRPVTRRALLLRELDGLNCTEIGAVLGKSQTATKSLLFRARDEFRRCWAAVGEEAPRYGAVPPPMMYRPWTADAEAARAMVADGATDAEIGARFGRTPYAVKQWRGRERVRSGVA